jgi:Tol biopolymer transport system component
VTRTQPGTAGDVFVLSTIGAFQPKPLVVTNAYEGGPHLSPDQRWFVHAATSGNRTAVFVRRYASPARKWQVSEDAGTQARWSADGREVYYYGPGLTIANFDATPDGRFLMIRRESQGGQLHIVLNWTEELKQIIARGGVR